MRIGLGGKGALALPGCIIVLASLFIPQDIKRIGNLLEPFGRFFSFHLGGGGC
jgi:hypothetical protein